LRALLAEQIVIIRELKHWVFLGAFGGVWEDLSAGECRDVPAALWAALLL